MSMARCVACDLIVDTDGDVEGVFEAVKPWGYFCSSCIEAAAADPEAGQGPRILAAVKAEDPGRYSELMESADAG